VSNKYPMGKILRFDPGNPRTGHNEFYDKVVTVQEKVDGSQFSFWKDVGSSTVSVASRNRMLSGEESRFRVAVAHVRTLDVPPGVIFRGEVVSKFRHNKIVYSRLPKHNLVLWDLVVLDAGSMPYNKRNLLKSMGERFDLEVVHEVCDPFKLTSADELTKLVEGPSAFGEEREGIVVRCRAGVAKLVGQKMSEHVHRRPRDKGDDLAAFVAGSVNAERIIEKAAEWLRDEGMLEFKDSDIGKVIRTVHEDLDNEFSADMRDLLFRKMRKPIYAVISRNVATVYRKLLSEGFANE